MSHRGGCGCKRSLRWCVDDLFATLGIGQAQSLDPPSLVTARMAESVAAELDVLEKFGLHRSTARE